MNVRSHRMSRWALCGGLLAALATACGSGSGGPQPPHFDSAKIPFEHLSDYGFFLGDDLSALEPAPTVIPYVVNSPLWSDGASKGRFFWVPEGGKIALTDKNEWDFPKGSIFIKTFYFNRDRRPGKEDLQLVETRLLVFDGTEWKPHIYEWDEAQTDADHLVAGDDVEIPYTDANGHKGMQHYIVPDQNTCENCHQRDDLMVILGPTTHQLNREGTIEGEKVNQIDWLHDNDLLKGSVPRASALPALAQPDGDASVDDRARSYLHGNCAHCHRPGADGGSSGLSWVWWNTDPAVYGVCKVPTAAGAGAGSRNVDIFPGHPELSIVPYRMSSTDPDVKMPELPNLLPDDFGVNLVKEWITAMPAQDCTAG